MRKGGGIIIRLIDVVLILLLGFLKVSDIVHKKQIKLPSRASSQRSMDKPKNVIPLKIMVMPTKKDDVISPKVALELNKINQEDEHFLNKKSQLYCYYMVLDSIKTRRVQLIEELNSYIDSTYRVYRANGDSMFVVINPDSNSIIQGTINLIDVCRRHNIKRSFMYDEGIGK